MTASEMKQLLAEQNTALVNAMIVTNQPINQRLDTMSDRVDELAQRVKEQNGRVGKSEVAIAESRQKIHHIEREVFNRRSTDKGVSDSDRGLTHRDVRLVLYGAGGVLAAFKGLPWLAQLLKSVAP